MLVWLTLPFYDFCGFRSVAVNSVYKLQFFTFIYIILVAKSIHWMTTYGTCLVLTPGMTCLSWQPCAATESLSCYTQTIRNMQLYAATDGCVKDTPSRFNAAVYPPNCEFVIIQYMKRCPPNRNIWALWLIKFSRHIFYHSPILMFTGCIIKKVFVV